MFHEQQSIGISTKIRANKYLISRIVLKPNLSCHFQQTISHKTFRYSSVYFQLNSLFYIYNINHLPLKMIDQLPFFQYGLLPFPYWFFLFILFLIFCGHVRNLYVIHERTYLTRIDFYFLLF
nr:hypothetical protein pLIS24_00126 [Listeria monocytogenes]